ncbi:hypothetical protein [Streptomyces flavalbus]|uniref:Uncharacterized protein n=1 Tax=Streptomyces flavalbus TaxID=2665155 RepID=A0ABW2W3Y6_9ACTN
MRRDVHEELRAQLREAAGTHQPDRARMMARIERGMAERERPGGDGAVLPPVWGWLRVAGATAAVAGVLAVGGYAVASAVREDAPPQGTVAVSATPTPSPDATSRPPAPPPDPSPSASAASRAPSASASRTPSSTATSTGAPPATATDVADGPLWSDGSVDPHSNEFWAQSNVTVKTTERLASLTVELRIAQTGGVTSTGAWRSLPEADFDLAVTERDGYLVYTWALKEGRTVPEGEFVFAGQYDHERGGRDAGDDDYTVHTTTTNAEPHAVTGDFAPQGEDD